MPEKSEVLRKFVHLTTCLGCIFLLTTIGHSSTIFFFLFFLANTWIYEKIGILEKIFAVKKNNFGHYWLSLGLLLPLLLTFWQLNNLGNLANSDLSKSIYTANLDNLVTTKALIFAVLVLGLADTAAALGGKIFSISFPHLHLQTIFKKTIFGSLFFALTVLILYLIIGPASLSKMLLVAVSLTLIEMLSPLGIDNLTLPISAYLLYIF